MIRKGKYLYGFVYFREYMDKQDKVPHEDAPNIVKEVMKCDSGAVGLDHSNVYLIHCNNGCNISVAVSDFDPIEFSDLPKETLLRYLSEHQNALEMIMKQYPVIPLKFGTMIENSDHIRHHIKNILEKGSKQIAETFVILKNKIELDVVAVFNNMQTVLADIGELDSVRKLKEDVIGKSKEDIYKAQIALGKMVKSYIDQKRKSYSDKILNQLKRAACDHKIHDVRDDSMICNIAFLINDRDQTAFEHTIDELDREFENTVNFRIVGPLPYNSFNTLMIAFADFEKIDFARKTLELPEKADLTEIKEAYRKMSIAYHPDSSSQDNNAVSRQNINDSQNRFEQINKSYQLLTDYCYEEKCSFLKEDVNEWIRVMQV